MWFLRNKPIKQKITLVILVTCSAALLLTGVALFGFQLFSFRQNFIRDLTALGEIIANHSTGAVSFKDEQSAREMLGALSAKKEILYAEIQTPAGQTLASYGKAPGFQFTGAHGVRIDRGLLVFARPVVLDGDVIGELYLISDYKGERQRLLLLNATILAVVLLVSILAALLISSKLQGVVSDPILKLVGTARAIAEQRDYSVRADRIEHDEIGLFTDAFNQMLGRIQDQDAELRVSQQKIETLIHSIEGIVLEIEPAGLAVKFVSQQAERLLGYPIAMWLQAPDFFVSRIHGEDRERVVTLYKDAIANQKAFAAEFRLLASADREIWVRNSTSTVANEHGHIVFRSLMLDITERKKAEKELERLHKQLVEASRHAGMAEVATGVLHNVGNILNSVNVSATLVCDKVRKSDAKVVARISSLINENSDSLGAFFHEHSKGKLIPRFMETLAEKLERDNAGMAQELELLMKNVEHIKKIVAMQQSYAKLAGLVESLAVGPLVEDALQMAYGSLSRHKIEIVRDYGDVPEVSVDRHKVLQILVNLIKNAKQAMVDVEDRPRQLRLGVSLEAKDRVGIRVQDTGIGIISENLTKIFAHGFTTKADGHGFGLHSGALAAKEMGGSLRALSDGPNMGATFLLQLPLSK